MLTAVAIIPSAPVLVPELAGAAAAELTDLYAAVRDAAAALPRRWIGIGTDTAEQRVDPDAAGTFAGYGAGVAVAMSPGAHASPTEATLPLCALVAGWLRGQVNPEVTAETRCYPNALDTSTALTRGRALRAEIDAHADPVGVLVVADGAHTLTPSAPGGYDPESVAVQTALDDALAVGDVAALADLPAAVVGRVAFAVLAGLAEPGPAAARELYRGAPYGVGYFVGVWRP